MGDPVVAKWCQQGVVSMWRNKHRHTDWNITADHVGCSALVQLLELMEKGNWPSKKTLSLSKPTITADHGGTLPFRAASSLTIKYPKDSVPDDHWVLQHHGGEVSLVVGLSRLHEFREAVRDLNKGGGDYCIGGDTDDPLWVWWYVSPLPDSAAKNRRKRK